MKRLALALSLFLGCYNSHDIRPAELSSLNGYAKDHPAEVHDYQGRPIRVDQRSKLFLTPNGGDTVGGQFDRIAVQGGLFVGKTSDGKIVSLRLPDISEASVDTYSRGQTIAGWVTAGVVVLGAVLAFTLLSWQQSGTCTNSSCSGMSAGTIGPSPGH